MAFWSNSSKVYEPLRQYRWYMLFGESALDKSRYALKDCSKPSFEIGISEHVLINDTFRFPKNLAWKPVTVKMAAVRDDKGDSLSKAFNDIIRKVGYATPAFSLQQISKNNFENNLAKSVELIQVDANGNDIEYWSLYNPIISDINYGTLSYGSEEIVEITFIINYDYATLATLQGEEEQAISP